MKVGFYVSFSFFQKVGEGNLFYFSQQFVIFYFWQSKLARKMFFIHYILLLAQSGHYKDINKKSFLI